MECLLLVIIISGALYFSSTFYDWKQEAKNLRDALGNDEPEDQIPLQI